MSKNSSFLQGPQTRNLDFCDLQVNKILRNHLIRPHWMFAMDNIIRRAVQAAVTILIPGKCCLLGQGQAQAMEETTSILCGQQLCSPSHLGCLLPCNSVNAKNFLSPTWVPSRHCQGARVETELVI